LTNQLKRNGETLSENRLVENILRSLAHTFKNMMCMIEELKDLAKLIVDELVGSLLAQEKIKKL
jgi:gag-polypeptide of LTR copia-type